MNVVSQGKQNFYLFLGLSSAQIKIEDGPGKFSTRADYLLQRELGPSSRLEILFETSSDGSAEDGEKARGCQCSGSIKKLI